MLSIQASRHPVVQDIAIQGVTTAEQILPSVVCCVSQSACAHHALQVLVESGILLSEDTLLLLHIQSCRVQVSSSYMGAPVYRQCHSLRAETADWLCRVVCGVVEAAPELAGRVRVEVMLSDAQPADAITQWLQIYCAGEPETVVVVGKSIRKDLFWRVLLGEAMEETGTADKVERNAPEACRVWVIELRTGLDELMLKTGRIMRQICSSLF